MKAPSEPAVARRSPIAWMAQNPVVANLLLIVLVAGGLTALPRITREVFPELLLDIVSIRVPYPSASPEEVEQGVLLAIEEEVRGLEGVKEVTSYADEGLGLVNVELLLGEDRQQMLSDIDSAVRRLTTLPEDAERPSVSLVKSRRQVISLIYYGDVDELLLRGLAERARDDLLRLDEINLAELSLSRPMEIRIEIARDELRRLGLSVSQVAERVRGASINLPAGDLETKDNQIVLRTAEREETAEAFEDVPLIVRSDGTYVRLGEVSKIHTGFRDVDQEAYYNGKPAVRLDVFRVGDETPLEVASVVKEFAERERKRLPDSIGVTTWDDISRIYDARMTLLLRNAYIGVALVLLLLGLFLAPSLAFWVTLGIPISFLGALALLPSMGVSINLISLFAFIITLGLVVDDAIVVGEATYRRRQDGLEHLSAAVEGAHEVGRPVIYSILTTCIAFTPMLFVPGVAGQFFRNIPIVVILVLAASLSESLLVLPAHLSHPMPRWLGLLLAPFLWLMSKLRSERVSAWLDRFVERRYVPAARRVFAHRYAALALGVALLALSAGLVLGGRLHTTFLPRIEDDQVRASIRLPVGASLHHTRAICERFTRAARSAAPEALITGVYAQLGVLPQLDQTSAAPPETGAHLVEVVVDLVPADERELKASEFTERWRAAVGSMPQVDRVVFKYTTGATAGAPINVRLTHEDEDALEAAAVELAAALRRYEGVVDVDKGFTRGRERVQFRVTPEGRSAGLSATHLATELRGSFYGAETQRFQQDRNEVRVYVSLPMAERASLNDLEELVLQTPGGGEIPLHEAADLTWDRSFTRIQRVEMQRAVNVTAHVIPGVANANEIMEDLSARILPELEATWPGLNHAPGGQQQTQGEAVQSLASGFAMALIAMFGLLAVAFRSYVQPLIVLLAIPFGAIGAIAGHILLGYNLSLSTMFGLVALAGVIVNDSLLIVVAINERRDTGHASRLEHVVGGAARRFRPIVMTSLTTFFGLSPMIFETSVQARFLIPMAIALGFGVLIGTLILVFVVPCLYLAVEDVRHLLRGVSSGEASQSPSHEAQRREVRG